ncbi:SPOR domain-containing protein [Thermodesulfobacteriota bacterium]
MAPKKPKKSTKKYQIELTTRSLFLCCFLLFFLLTWIFVFGIWVGREFSTGTITPLTGIENPFSTLRGIVSHDRSRDRKSTVEPSPDPKLTFYEKLSTKKDEAKKKWVPEDERPPEKPAKAPEPLQAVQESLKKESEQRDSSKSARKIEDSEPSDYFTVQLASLEEQNKAERMIRRLNAKGYPAYYYEVKLQGRSYYRIRCGKFPSRQEAQAYARKLAKERGMKGFVSRLE